MLQQNPTAATSGRNGMGSYRASATPRAVVKRSTGASRSSMNYVSTTQLTSGRNGMAPCFALAYQKQAAMLFTKACLSLINCARKTVSIVGQKPKVRSYVLGMVRKMASYY